MHLLFFLFIYWLIIKQHYHWLYHPDDENLCLSPDMQMQLILKYTGTCSTISDTKVMISSLNSVEPLCFSCRGALALENCKRRLTIWAPWCKWGRSVLDKLPFPVLNGSCRFFFGQMLRFYMVVHQWMQTTILFEAWCEGVMLGSAWASACWACVFSNQFTEMIIILYISFLTTRCTCTE